MPSYELVLSEGRPSNRHCRSPTSTDPHRPQRPMNSLSPHLLEGLEVGRTNNMCTEFLQTYVRFRKFGRLSNEVAIIRKVFLDHDKATMQVFVKILSLLPNR